MSAAYQELRTRARALALTTLFETPDDRDIICDLLQFGLELEKISEIASEPMLALIRMQWWHDLFDANNAPHEAPDFAKRLYDNPAIDNKNLCLIVQDTQDLFQSPNPEVSWPTLFVIIGQSASWKSDDALLRAIGQMMGALYQKESRTAIHSLSDKNLKQVFGKHTAFPRLVNLLCERQKAGKSQDDMLLVFRYLAKIIF